MVGSKCRLCGTREGRRGARSVLWLLGGGPEIRGSRGWWRERVEVGEGAVFFVFTVLGSHLQSKLHQCYRGNSLMNSKTVS